jgi:hypothetical protein
LKFWFNIERQYLGVTEFVNYEPSSIENYDLQITTAYKCEHLEKIYVKFAYHNKMICTTWIQVGIRYGVFGTPNTRYSKDHYQHYGSEGLRLDSAESIWKLIPKSESEIDKDDRSPDLFNRVSSYSKSNDGIKIKQFLKDADFCLALNISSIKDPKNKLSVKSSSRKSSKENSFFLKDDSKK